ncbi:helix-turn-helix transcriptional regulator [Nocardioides sp. MAHUQ-72]|uniref:helix-turn-helix transcriptional regulator n=1 Tax=unclassified Nocardioides TaxID=2615069 RepID=UPI0036100FA3
MGSRASGPQIGVGLGPRNRIPEAERQAVLDAAAVLQVRRSETADLVSRGPVPGVEIVGSGPEDVNRWMLESSASWRELLSVRPAATATQLRLSLPMNRAKLEGGLRMTSIFSADGLELDARLLLANEALGDYRFSVAPVQMKIVDRAYVLLQGPVVDGESSVMAVSSGPCLDAAWRYWHASLDSSFPAIEGVGTLGDLTPRQRQVVALLMNGVGDEAIAETLSVSVRTVRADVAALLAMLGVRSRFAAGARLQLWSSQES